ncbi:MAG: class I SAM-dependent methyltransferase [Acidimicrobiales bacterium]
MNQDVDSMEAALFALKVWKYKEGELVTLMMHVGDQLGLYTQMRGRGPITATMLADQTGLDERWLLEWLRGQAAAELLTRSADDAYELTDTAAEVLANEESSLLFAAGAMAPPPDSMTVPRLLESFRTGVGPTWDDQGSDRAATVDRNLGVWTRLALVDQVVPALDGVQEKLQNGIDVVEVGCGAGAAMLTLAAAFGQSRFVGIDPSVLAIQLADEKLAATGLTNVSFQADYGEHFESDTNFEFVLTFDCLHHMPFPELTMQNIRNHIAEDATWLVKDIRCSPDFHENRKNPVHALMYGYSLTACLPSGLSEPDGLGLGTLGMHPSLLQQMSEKAGFTRFKIHDFEDPANLYYEIRP